jgi:hypothetical protein
VPGVTAVVANPKVGAPVEALPFVTTTWPEVPVKVTWEKFVPLMVTKPIPVNEATLESVVPSDITGFPATPSPLAILRPLPTPKVRPTTVFEFVLTCMPDALKSKD